MECYRRAWSTRTGVEHADAFRDSRSGYFTTDDHRPWQEIYASQLAQSVRPLGSRCAAE